jgi:hypothetical protein
MKSKVEFQWTLGRRAFSSIHEWWKSVRSAGAMGLAALAIMAAISMLVAALVLPSKIMADDDEVSSFTVDVALGSPYFQNDIDPAEGQVVFTAGDTFIQDGNIYPENTIPNGKTDFDPNTSGAIGKYKVRGTWTTDSPHFELAAAHMTAPPDLAFASEIFSFGNDQTLILTDGILPNAYFSARRVVLGGTGRFRGVIGEVHEDNIGENSSTSCNFRVTFKIRKASARGDH